MSGPDLAEAAACWNAITPGTSSGATSTTMTTPHRSPPGCLYRPDIGLHVRIAGGALTANTALRLADEVRNATAANCPPSTRETASDHHRPTSTPTAFPDVPAH